MAFIGDAAKSSLSAGETRELIAFIREQESQLTAASTRERALREKVALMRRVILGTAWLEMDGDQPRKCIKCHRLLDSSNHIEGCLVGQALANETEAT